jgi:hypothetical protein
MQALQHDPDHQEGEGHVRMGTLATTSGPSGRKRTTNLSGYELPPKPLTKKQKKEQNLKQWEAENVVGST